MVMRMQGDRRLLSLVIVHLVFGLVAAIIAKRGLAFPGRMNLLFMIVAGLCQAFFLSLWAVTSSAPHWKKIMAVVTGAIYLEILLGSAVARDFGGIATVTLTATAAFLLVLRAKGVSCVRQVREKSVTEPIRFSIRSLMLLIAVAALLIAAARTLQGMTEKTLPLNIYFSLCIVTVGLVATWAVLGASEPFRRSAIVLILSPVLGVLFAIAASADQGAWVLIILTTVLYSVTMLASLLVVRSCGYRWVRRAPLLPEQPPGEKNVGGSLPV
jgi:hypothetical protein